MKYIKHEKGEIHLQKLKGRFWAISIPLHIAVKTDEGWLLFDFKEGYKTDLGSIPQRLLGIVDNGSGNLDLLAFYLVHDAIYGGNFKSQKFADNLLFQMMEELSEEDPKGEQDDTFVLDPWDRYLAKLALWWGGADNYKRTEEELIQFRKTITFNHSDKSKRGIK